MKLRIVMTIMRKELLETLRDKRSLVEIRSCRAGV